ncbi:MAG: SAM-dependent methyltransferase [Hyphomicrobiales bacterium]|nr:SAM-dependent methyltransferase [Hyphomicrobiales bacterium]
MSAPLLVEIRRRIEQAGPMSMADYMELALGDPAHGYYPTRDPFGGKGDFITAPEISQMFGEIVGIWTAHMWGALGRPAPFAFIELGPGRGTLMADMLRAGSLAPGFAEAARVHLVETSPALRCRQRAALREADVPVSWHQSFAEVPPGPMILVANEFFDALPVHQYARAQDGWRERVVGLDPAGHLSLQTAETRSILAEFGQAEPGTVVEISPQRAAFSAEIGARLAQSGGAALIIDYGYSGPAPGDTFQAVKGHAYADPLENPGEADLTAHVDFAALCGAARAAGARSYGPITQAAFLTALGIAVRADKLKVARPDQAAKIDAALARLIGPDEMGTLFKVAALTGPAGPPPPPFAGD